MAVTTASSGQEMAAAARAHEDSDFAWGRVGMWAAYFSGGVIMLVIVLVLLDSFDLLARFNPPVKNPSTDQLTFNATWYAAWFAHQRQILWDIDLRDSLGPLGFLALVIVGLAVLNRFGRGRGDAQLTAVFLGIGGVVQALNAIPFLTAASYWGGNWTADPAAQMVAVGRITEALTNMSSYLEVAGVVTLGIGAFFLGRLAGAGVGLPPRLGLLAYGVFVTAVLGEVAGQLSFDTGYKAILLVNAILVPAPLIWLGTILGRTAGSAST